jgi:hypothetical protein
MMLSGLVWSCAVAPARVGFAFLCSAPLLSRHAIPCPACSVAPLFDAYFFLLSALLHHECVLWYIILYTIPVLAECLLQ